MTRHQTPTTRRTVHRMADKRPLTTSLAAVVLQGQRLRADETVTATTLAMNFAAKWRQNLGGGR